MQRRTLFLNLAFTALAVCVGVVAMLLWAVEHSPERRVAALDEEVAAVQRLIGWEHADLMRERAECQAAVREYGDAYAASCWDGYRLQARLAAERIGKAEAALRSIEAKRPAR